MTIKKILAGVLAAASVLSVSVTASAVEAPDKTKAITKPGDTEYEAGVSLLTAELDVELPAGMKAFINAYGAEVAVDEAETPTKISNGVLSWAYEVVNNTEDFGVMIDVKTGFKATPSTGVTVAAPAASMTAGKNVAVVLQSGSTVAMATTYDGTKTTSAPATATTAGYAVFASTAASTAVEKFAYAPAKTDAGAGKAYIAFTGAVGKAEWTADDTVTCTYTLKLNPAKKTATAAFA